MDRFPFADLNDMPHWPPQTGLISFRTHLDRSTATDYSPPPHTDSTPTAADPACPYSPAICEHALPHSSRPPKCLGLFWDRNNAPPNSTDQFLGAHTCPPVFASTSLPPESSFLRGFNDRLHPFFRAPLLIFKRR